MSDAKQKARSNPLFDQMDEAINKGHLIQRFTAEIVKAWMTKFNIRKGDGTQYSKGYVTTRLSNGLIKTKKTKNRNSRRLKREMNNDGIFEYWFADTE